MADLTIFEKYPGSYRLDQPDFSHVSKCNYAKGIVTAFYAANDDDPLVVKDVCDLMVGDQKFEKVPIFYHPPKTYADNWKLNAEPSVHPYGGLPSPSAAWADFWKASGSLVDAQGEVVADIPEGGLVFKDQAVARGAYSFSVDDEVAVMLQEGIAVAVIGFADGIPRRPFDYVEVNMPPQVLDTFDPNEPIGDPHCPYILQLSDTIRLVTPSGPEPGTLPPTGGSLGPDGFDLKLLKDAKVFPDEVAHPTPGPPILLEFQYRYQCFYGQPAPRGDIILDPNLFNPIPDYQFGPFFGYMRFNAPNDPFEGSWVDYLAQWLSTCDTIQTTQEYGGPNQPWAGLWPLGLGRPFYWLWLFDDPSNAANQTTTDYVMRTYMIEAGPIVYLARVFYQHTTPPAHGGKVWYWKNRIAWPWSFAPRPDWSGYSDIDPMTWTPPMWVPGYCPNPTPANIENCIPPPDGYLPGIRSQETFASDNPYFVYAAPSSKEILDGIEGIVAASNSGVDVTAAMGGSQIPQVPEGFRDVRGKGVGEEAGAGFLIPPVGNLRELNFKIAARIGT